MHEALGLKTTEGKYLSIMRSIKFDVKTGSAIVPSFSRMRLRPLLCNSLLLNRNAALQTDSRPLPRSSILVIPLESYCSSIRHLSVVIAYYPSTKLFDVYSCFAIYTVPSAPKAKPAINIKIVMGSKGNINFPIFSYHSFD